jgi:nucleotide-binding universal stress UspA family protein
MYRHILIPTDGSELSRRAVHHGLSLAKSVGAKVTALTVEGSFNVYDVPASKVYEMSGSFAEHVERTKAHAEKILNSVAEEARSAGVTCEAVQVEQDHPSKPSSRSPSREAVISSSWPRTAGAGLRQSCLAV